MQSDLHPRLSQLRDEPPRTTTRQGILDVPRIIGRSLEQPRRVSPGVLRVFEHPIRRVEDRIRAQTKTPPKVGLGKQSPYRPNNNPRTPFEEVVDIVRDAEVPAPRLRASGVPCVGQPVVNRPPIAIDVRLCPRSEALLHRAFPRHSAMLVPVFACVLAPSREPVECRSDEIRSIRRHESCRGLLPVNLDRFEDRVVGETGSVEKNR